MNGQVDSANVRFPPPLIYLGFLVFGIWAGRAFAFPDLGMESSTRDLFGWGVIAIGVIVGPLAGAGLFHRLRTAIIPFKPASRLVTSGIYRWTRNPMYLGMALIYAGIAVLFDSLLALVLLIPVLIIIQLYVIAREEAYLERTFGDEYLAYKARVRRWL
ncbi:MAG TPA: isoprenylcysteine carboxylmethyltransferase family protein [Sphingomicrobium sp.]|nr:isoprenylcysteine carboxylmethyltransferase family protein [Sphingomicrobium sp.]